jgi:uncharacterized protein YndB with AHSA1/START domain
MRSADGQDFWSTGMYKEIVPFERIVATDCFSDEKGNIVPSSYYGMNPDFPIEMEISVMFEENNGKTKMTLIHKFLPEGNTFDQTREGWNESFNKLKESLNILINPSFHYYTK